MTIGEFKAWLDGFMDGKKQGPGVEDWKKIKEKLEEVQESRCNHYPWPYTIWSLPGLCQSPTVVHPQITWGSTSESASNVRVYS